MYKTFVLPPYEKTGHHSDNGEFGIQVSIMYIGGKNIPVHIIVHQWLSVLTQYNIIRLQIHISTLVLYRLAQFRGTIYSQRVCQYSVHGLGYLIGCLYRFVESLSSCLDCLSRCSCIHSGCLDSLCSCLGSLFCYRDYLCCPGVYSDFVDSLSDSLDCTEKLSV